LSWQRVGKASALGVGVLASCLCWVLLNRGPTAEEMTRHVREVAPGSRLHSVRYDRAVRTYQVAFVAPSGSVVSEALELPEKLTWPWDSYEFESPPVRPCHLHQHD
jgi:hypothetical protein